MGACSLSPFFWCARHVVFPEGARPLRAVMTGTASRRQASAVRRNLRKPQTKFGPDEQKPDTRPARWGISRASKQRGWTTCATVPAAKAEPELGTPGAATPTASKRGRLDERPDGAGLEPTEPSVQAGQGQQGAPGVDGMTVSDLYAWLGQHKDGLIASLLDGSYQPQEELDGWCADGSGNWFGNVGSGHNPLAGTGETGSPGLNGGAEGCAT